MALFTDFLEKHIFIFKVILPLPSLLFFFFSLNQNKFELSVLLEQNLITLTAYRLICLPGGLDCLFFRNNLISASSLFFSF